MTSNREIALRLASAAVPRMVEKLDRLIESAPVSGYPRAKLISYLRRRRGHELPPWIWDGFLLERRSDDTC
jgi:hypothetical protein